MRRHALLLAPGAWMAAILLIASALLMPALSHAQGEDLSIYQVNDVPVDITADSAAHARDQAIAQAQRLGLQQLLGRLGADPALAAKVSDDDIATLVQNFEMQNERSSSVRYIGTFTVQFRPVATRDWLNQAGASFTETRSKPLLILPVYMSNHHPVLWEERTKWWTAWDNARNDGLVPFFIPSGDLDDISALSTEEAVNGDASSIKALAEKYQAGGAAVVSLEGDLDNSGPPFKIKIVRYDGEGVAADPINMTLPPAADKPSIDATLAQAVKQVRSALEGNWRQVVAKANLPPPSKLAVAVPTASIADWTQIKRKLSAIHEIDSTNMLMLARGISNVEINFHGSVEQLQEDLARENLVLQQQLPSGGWILQPATAQMAPRL